MRLVSGSLTRHISSMSSGRNMCILLFLMDSSSSKSFLLCFFQNLSFTPYEKQSTPVSSAPHISLYPLPSSLALDLLLLLESPNSSPVSAPTLQPPALAYKLRHLIDIPLTSSSSSDPPLWFFFLNF
ncbi:hypothetical protein PanWU01x14_355680 [Parasponia andersonii]|uniref:Uncharacterized protein n=1 Tax=Parasponia andersonii TaxID=3476 RepID=A0A2P5A997_PARAD|nr:hypothetical protein PanWU01x14_355680 [Parasponia andersonii]